MSFAVETELLRKQAKEWGQRRDDVDAVNKEIATSVGMGYKFGVLAGSNGVEEAYNLWSNCMQDSLEDASISFNYLSVALTSTADNYDASDQTAALSVKELDKVLEESDYHE